MSNALMRLNRNGNTELNARQAMFEEEDKNEVAAYNTIPTRIKLASGGANAFLTNDGEMLKKLSGIVVVSQKGRVYWPAKDLAAKAPPLCSSPDGAIGMFALQPTDADLRAAMGAKKPHPAIHIIDAHNGKGAPQLPESFSCATCPLAEFGSAHQDGKKGKSTACKELRRLVLVVDGWAMPALLTIPPTSIGNFDMYASGLRRRNERYWSVRTEITLSGKSSNGNAYSVAEFSFAGDLSDAEVDSVREVRRQFEEYVRASAITPDEYTTVGNGGGSGTPDEDEEPPL